MRLSGIVVALVLVPGVAGLLGPSPAIGAASTECCGERTEKQPAGPLTSVEDDAEEKFPDYEPKLSPDTVLDYRPEMAIGIGTLPPAELGSLPDLVRALELYAARARDNPGHWEDGQIMLGAEPTEYVPSDDELIASETGERIGQIVADTSPEDVEEALAAAGLTRDGANYDRFTFRHADVMGSGRFFFASPPEPVRVTFGLSGDKVD
jgi:hypothetical protein